MDARERWPFRFLATGYLPVAFASILLTGSRSGLVVAVVASTGYFAILSRRNSRALMTVLFILLPLGATVWWVAPHETLLRFGSILDQLRNADLNQRVSIWAAGWHAFLAAPTLGHGAGTFVIAARLAPEDTAHNTVLSILVEGGLIALTLAGAIVTITLRSMVATTGALRKTLFTLMLCWLISSVVGTVGENRITWLLLSMAVLAERLTKESPQNLDRAFSDPLISTSIRIATETP
jgi:O-antigen ligase